ncbi:MAG TPA: S26 family signal peptidase [Candidatus Saccharimonadales bacterium]|nr:S26 family signal peptidase [Candidatus Saccharimonadales bacterium]
MQPTLQPRQLVVGIRVLRRLQPGQIVIIRHQGIEKIKRVAHMQGDQLFVVGDNPGQSTDSRSFGMLPRSVVIAKVVWPRLTRPVPGKI